jgi:hypothetical protein
MTLDQCASDLADACRSGKEYAEGWIDDAVNAYLASFPLPQVATQRRELAELFWIKAAPNTDLSERVWKRILRE